MVLAGPLTFSCVNDGRNDNGVNLLQQYFHQSSTIKSDIRLWKEDLVAGRFEANWLAAANRASARRARCELEEFEKRRVREAWGVSVVDGHDGAADPVG